MVGRKERALKSKQRENAAKRLQAEIDSAITIIEQSGPPPDACLAYVHESSMASIWAMYYSLYSARHKDREGLMRALGSLPNCKNERAFEDRFLHSLVSLLIPFGEVFSTEDFCSVIFDKFFSAGLSRDNVPKHLLRLLIYVHTKLPEPRMVSLSNALQPNSELIVGKSRKRVNKILQQGFISWMNMMKIPGFKGG